MEHSQDARHPDTSALHPDEPAEFVTLDAFSAWLDDSLEELEERFRSFWTRRSLITVLLSQSSLPR